MVVGESGGEIRRGRETEGDGVAVGTHDDDGHTTFGEGGEGGEGEGGFLV